MKKKYAEILLHYSQLFIKDDVFIGEWDAFGAEVFLCYSQFFIKGNFFIGRVECIHLWNEDGVILLLDSYLRDKSENTGGSHLSWIFGEHGNLSGISVLIYILYKEMEKNKFWQKSGLSE